MVKTLEKIEKVDSLWKKTIGVIGKKDFGNFNGLLLTNTNAIHTFFVSYPLDLVFLDSNFKVLRLVEGLNPWSFSPIVWKAKHTLEMPKDSISKFKLAVGDTIHLK